MCTRVSAKDVITSGSPLLPAFSHSLCCLSTSLHAPSLTRLQDFNWYWGAFDWFLSAGNIYVLAVVPWVVFSGWRYVRCSSAACLATGAIAANSLVGCTRSALSASSLGSSIPGFSTISLAVVWLGQLVPAVLAPYVLGGAVRGFIRRPVRLQCLAFTAIVVFAYFCISILAPAFAVATPLMQSVLRVVVFTFGLEVTVAVMRVGSKLAFTRHMPRDRLLALTGSTLAVAAVSGRMLVASMDTALGTLALSLAIAVTEITLRLTMPARDEQIMRCVRMICPSCREDALSEPGAYAAPDSPPAAGPRQTRSLTPSTVVSASPASASHGVPSLQDPAMGRFVAEAQDIHAYFSMLTLDTMAEDLGILTSLPFGLLMAFPSRTGGAPPSHEDVIFRVALQYIIELITDMSPALIMLAVNTCCGVRWNAVSGQQARSAGLAALFSEAQDQSAKGVKVAVPSSEVSIDDSLANPEAPTPTLSKLPVRQSPNAVLLAPGTATPSSEPDRRSQGQASQPSCSQSRCCTCFLLPDDPDVQEHRAHLRSVYDAEIDRIAADALWSPVSWRGLLEAQFTGGAPPPTLLFAPVASPAQMSSAQGLVAWLSIRAEVLTARMHRAWTTRFRGWTLLFLVGALNAVMLAGRNFAGPFLRCMKEDDEKLWFDYCPEES